MYNLIKLSFFVIVIDAIWIYFIMLKKFNKQIEIVQLSEKCFFAEK